MVVTGPNREGSRAGQQREMSSRGDDDRFDGMYLNLAQQNQGIDNLLESFFGFLRRKTDFYTGASEAQLEESLLKVRYCLLYRRYCFHGR